MPNRMEKRAARFKQMPFSATTDRVNDALRQAHDIERQCDQGRSGRCEAPTFIKGEVEIHLPPDVRHSNSISDQKKEARETIKQWVDRVTLFFVIVVALINAIQTKIANESVRTTKEAVRAAQKANQLVSDNFHMENAPYISIVGIQTAPDTNKAEVLAYRLKNVGNTPALNTHSFVNFASDARSEIPQFTWEESRTKGRTSLQKDSADSVALNAPIDPRIVASYHAGTRTAFLALRVWYDDVWNEHHVLTFCNEFNPATQQWQLRNSDCTP